MNPLPEAPASTAARPPGRAPKLSELGGRHFRWFVVAIAVGFFLLQLRYIAGLPLVMDEFANAGHIYRVGQGIPYRDYEPYKTVVGYYLLLPGLVGFSSSWAGMLAAKAEIALLTSVTLALGGVRLRRHFAPAAVVGSLLLLCTQSTFLERASELRVDMLSALFGLISLLAFLERRAVMAGAAAGAALLMTQKGVYFLLSLAGSAMFLLLRWRSRTVLVEAVRAGLAAIGVVGAYIGFWCLIGNPGTLWQSMFEGPRRIAFAPLYSLGVFWTQTLERNPIFFAVGAAGLLLLVPWRGASSDSASGRLWSYSVIQLACCVWHKQPWPYFFVMLIPTAWVLSAAVLERQIARGRRWAMAVGGLVLVGAAVSAFERIPVVLKRSSTEQRRVIEAAEAFLAPGEAYLAGTELLWRRPHIQHLSWLDTVRIADIARDPGLPLRELRESPPRLVIANYRVARLPRAFQEVLAASFVSVGGNLSTYGPRLREGVSEPSFAYAGLYRVTASAGGRVSIDGGPWLHEGDCIRLSVGRHQVHVDRDARLASWSDDPSFVERTMRPSVVLFENVYLY